MLLTNKEHFIATRPKTQPHVRKEGQQRFTKVKFLEQKLLQPGRPRGHVWVVNKGHYKCSTCNLGLHKGLPWRAIKKAVQSDCNMRPHLTQERLPISWPADSTRPVKADKEVSKMAFLEELVNQGFATTHDWQWSAKGTGVTCQSCSAWISKAFAWPDVRGLVDAQCEIQHGPPKGVKLHSSHDMAAEGRGWRCTRCRHLMQPNGTKWKLEQPLQSRCSGILDASQSQLNRFFGSQARRSSEAGSQSSPEEELMHVDFF